MLRLAEPNPEVTRAGSSQVDADGFLPLRIVSRRHHFHMPGVVYVVTTMIIVVGAVNGQNNLLFWLFGLAVGGLVVSGIVSSASLLGTRLERWVPSRARVGEPCEVKYRITNRNRFFPAFALTIEELPTPFRKGEIPTWPTRVPMLGAFCSGVRVRQRRVSKSIVTPFKRGEATFVAVRVSSTFPFGITRKSVVFVGVQRVLVWPTPIPMNIASHSGGREGTESVTAGQRAGAGEFLALREYVPGDPLRSIAWRPTSRLGRPIVREFAKQASKRMWLVCDIPPGIRELHAERIISTVAGLAESASRAGVHVGLANPNPISHADLHVSIGTGPRHERHLLDALAVLSVTPQGTTRQEPLDAPSIVVGPVGGARGDGSRVDVPPPHDPDVSAPQSKVADRVKHQLTKVWTEWLSPNPTTPTKAIEKAEGRR